MADVTTRCPSHFQKAKTWAGGGVRRKLVDKPANCVFLDENSLQHN